MNEIKHYYIFDPKTYEAQSIIEAIPNRIPPNATEVSYDIEKSKKYKTVWIKEKNKWEYMTNKQFTEHLVKLNVLSVAYNQKIDEEGNIIEKTQEELVNEGHISLDIIKERKKSLINSKAKEIIEGGFISNVTGKQLKYHTKLEDQFNIKVLEETNMPQEIRCVQNDKNVYVKHTAEQLKELVKQFINHKQNILRRCHELKIQVDKAKSYTEVEEIEIDFEL